MVAALVVNQRVDGGRSLASADVLVDVSADINASAVVVVVVEVMAASGLLVVSSCLLL